MQQYLDLLNHVKLKGYCKNDRTGTGTLSVFGEQMRFNLQQGFPLVTTKKVHLKSVIHELLWFLRGETNTSYLEDNGVTIWREWQNEDGDLGPIYGHQWRSWPTPEGGHIDQIAQVLQQLKTDPDSRRILVSAWNVAELEKMALPPCHLLFQFYSRELTHTERLGITDAEAFNNFYGGMQPILGTMSTFLDGYGVPKRGLSCQIYQRSADLFLGVPFNIASYALLTMIIAKLTDHLPLELVWTGGDCHIYDNHMRQVNAQLAREPMPLPEMILPNFRNLDEATRLSYSDFTLRNYRPHAAIAAPVAV